MALIEFKNKPDTTTPINANNLNFNFEEVMNLIYPVNSILIKADNEDYSDWLGFEWERTLVGKVAVGIDSSGSELNAIDKVGGSKDSQKHNHFAIVGEPNSQGNMDFPAYAIKNVQTTSVSEEKGYGAGTSWYGNGDSGNLQPYQVVAFWKRIA